MLTNTGSCGLEKNRLIAHTIFYLSESVCCEDNWFAHGLVNEHFSTRAASGVAGGLATVATAIELGNSFSIGTSFPKFLFVCFVCRYVPAHVFTYVITPLVHMSYY